ncbi:MAG: YbhB/YbcL family Raf kinase inhibitor-like protein [bacterium]|nr:YbhB/YbcL family Raf kinase inhibitor-like protein [bacterium]
MLTLAALAFTLLSPAFAAGAPIPRAHANAGAECGSGGNLSPPLQWSGVPKRTRSFALTLVDPDAKAPGGWVHWVAYDIPPQTSTLAAGARPAHEALTSFGTAGYGGPCPPGGDPPHHYHFTLYALDLAALTLPSRPRIGDVLAAMKGHILGEATLIGTYQQR